VVAAVWSVWTWKTEQADKREVHRDQEAALFVNALMIATDALQARLYSLLEEDDLAYSREEHPGPHELASPAAIAVLFRFSQYFGWAYRTLRFGPYTQDRFFVEQIRKIGDLLGTRRMEGEAFRFSLDERVALGEAVVVQVGEVNSLMPLLSSISIYQFQ